MLKFYEVDGEYIKYLRETGDSRIPIIDYNLNLPICSTLYKIIYKNSDAEEEIKKL